MSGIGVIFHRNRRPVKRDEIEKMARGLRIYGPERLVFSLAGSAALAYTHRSNTPESVYDDQPFHSGDGRYSMVFDGRLDNREDIQRELNLSDANVATMSDGRLALASFVEHRETAPERWVGEFAFIVWDKREAILCAARDQLGRRLLVWHETPDRIVIASAAKGIFALGDVAKEIDEQKVADALGQLYHDQTRSFFKNIRRLPHAQIMVASESGLRFATYWNIRDVHSIRLKSDRDYVEAARDRLDRAVKAQMRSNGGVGAFMSGGWDSTTVAITALKYLKSEAKLPVFTSVPESGWDGKCAEREYGDETPYVEAIARKHPRLELNLVPAQGLNQYHLQDEFIDAAEGPARNALNLSWLHEIQSTARARGITTLLEGTMGNLTLTWHGRDVSREWFWSGQWARMVRHWWRLYGGRNRSLARFLPRAVWHELIAAEAPEWMWRLYSSRFEKRSDGPRWQRFSAIKSDYASRMSLDARAKHFNFSYFDRLRYSTRAERLAMLTTSFSNELGPVYQGMRALHGVELRDPLADRRLIEFCFGIPTEQFANHGRFRWLVERMMAEDLPSEITKRRAVAGRQCADWHSRMTRDLDKIKSDITTLETDEVTSAMIDTDRIRTALDNWPNETVTDLEDDCFFFLPTIIPLTMQVGRFVRMTRGANN